MMQAERPIVLETKDGAADVLDPGHVEHGRGNALAVAGIRQHSSQGSTIREGP